MVNTPSSLLLSVALATLLASKSVDAGAIELNPSTKFEEPVVLNRQNPVYGASPAQDMAGQIVVPHDETLSRQQVQELVSNSTGNSTTQQNRKLEVTSSDIKRLEDYFGTPMETNVNTIYKQWGNGAVKKIPWPSSYWPTYQDSINARWTNEVSPSEKYAKAFGFNVKSFMDTVSQKLGIDSQADGSRVCTADNQCYRFNDGSACSKRYGSSTGYCVPTWYGICHAWAPAAIWEDEPRCDVVKNGVTFHPFDIKAIITAIYDGANVPIVFTGARYNGPGSDVDEYGRYTDAAERDLGPGFFHIAVTNIMGRFGKSFIVDVNADAQVWNQPVRSYKLDAPKIMTPSQAASTYFGVPKYPFNNAAKSIAYMHMAFSYINEYFADGPLVETGEVNKATYTRDYYYLLELDDQQRIIGGEWVYGSKTDHPDFLWFDTAKPSIDTVTELGLSYKEVQALLQQSVACGSNTPTPTTPTPTIPTPTTPTPTTPTPTTPTPTTPTPTTPTPTTTQPSTPTPPVSGGACGNDQTGPLACPSGEYCQPWNPSFYQCRRLDAKCGKQETGVDYYGDDIATFQLLLPEQCCDQCYATAGCKAYTFVNYNADGKAYCYLKKGTGQRSNKVGVVSATISSPSTATPTPPPASGNYCGNDQSGPQNCPSGEYCQPWNPSFYQCRRLADKCGKQEVGVDYYGDDIATYQLLLPEDCCDKCSATAGCKAYTFVNYNADGKAYCYLKKGTGTKQAKVGVVSAAMASRR